MLFCTKSIVASSPIGNCSWWVHVCDDRVPCANMESFPITLAQRGDHHHLPRRQKVWQTQAQVKCLSAPNCTMADIFGRNYTLDDIRASSIHCPVLVLICRRSRSGFEVAPMSWIQMKIVSNFINLLRIEYLHACSATHFENFRWKNRLQKGNFVICFGATQKRKLTCLKCHWKRVAILPTNARRIFSVSVRLALTLFTCDNTTKRHYKSQNINLSVILTTNWLKYTKSIGSCTNRKWSYFGTIINIVFTIFRLDLWLNIGLR